VPIYEITRDAITEIARTTFAEAGLSERMDLQRLLRERIEILSPDTLVIAEEFSDWDDSKRRIDLLGIDRDAKLVVIELKRTEDGGHMELQALRYAAMVSTMTFERAVAALARFRGIDSDDAQAQILDFLGWDEPDPDSFAQDVRIVLASAEFSKELTTAVIWLNRRNLDIRCVRLRPHRDGSRVLVDVAQVLPVPEAEDYQVRLREKESSERTVTSRPWTPQELLEELRNAGADARTAASFVEWVQSKGVLLRWRRGKERGSVRGLLVFGRATDRYSLFALRSDGILVMWIDRLKGKSALADGKLLAAFQSTLAAIPGIEIAGELDVRPRFPIGLLADPANWEAFTSALGSLVHGIRAWYAERGVATATEDQADDD
jgi:RecB family endonuclease NucS